MTPTLRRIKSFTRREGRLTPSQQQSLEQNWDQYVLDPQDKFEQQAVFSRKAPLVLEIGFGNGESLFQMARTNRQTDFIGIEVHRPGVAQLMRRLQEEELNNVRIYCADAVEILRDLIPDNALDTIQLFFADPWPKKRHHKRRIVQPDFTALVTRKLKKGGIFHAATDWEDYAEHMLEVISANDQLKNCSEHNTFIERPENRPLTKFEQRGLRLGHPVNDLMFRRV